ncbi:MAG: TetR/AcrR family transcriptional regulator [Cellvibrionaceae bacterium]
MGLTTTTEDHFIGSTFEEYKAHFQYQDDQLFNLLFERNQERIKSKKVEVAAANLKKIFDATFHLSAKIGFHEMSLRDLSKETGISMGGLYSCLTKKEDIALMVLDIVEIVSQENNEKVTQETDELSSLEMAIKYHLYSSTILQPWFFFLYFETRCLSAEDQIKSKAIELSIIETIETVIQSGVDKGIFSVNSPYFVAQTILIAIQDWYLKPWKNKRKNIDLEQYSKYLFIMVKKLLLIT